MRNHSSVLRLLVLAGAISLSSAPGLAGAQTPQREQIYGSQLMTLQERNEYRDRLRNARSAEERERIRAEHHERMQARARERGVTLPDQPPAGRGYGTGPGYGP